MTTYGVTEAGYVAKPYDVILDETLKAFRAAFGDGVGDTEDEIVGVIATILADRESSIWDLAEALHLAGTPDGAAGVPLIELAGLTGTKAQTAKASTTRLYCIGDLGTSVNGAVVAMNGNPDVRFIISGNPNVDDQFDNPPAWAANTKYFYGQYVRGDGDNLYVCQTPGSGLSGETEPTGTGVGISDDNLNWNYVDDPTLGVAYLAAGCDQTGPITAAERTLTVISTPVEGWRSVFNPEAATPGQTREPDPLLRLRREEELASSGNATVAAIRAHLLELGAPEVNSAFVGENVLDVADSNGTPPHSVVAVVESGLEDPETSTFGEDVSKALWASKPAGIRTYGDQTYTVTDEVGDTHPVHWAEPGDVEIRVVALIKVASGGGNLNAAIMLDALEALGNRYEAGATAYADELYEALRDVRAAAGFVSIQDIKLGLTLDTATEVEIAMPAPAQLHRPALLRNRIFLCPNWLPNAQYNSPAGGNREDFVHAAGSLWYCASNGVSGSTAPNWAASQANHGLSVEDGSLYWHWLKDLP